MAALPATTLLHPKMYSQAVTLRLSKNGPAKLRQLIVKLEIIVNGCYKPLNFGMVCNAAIDNWNTMQKVYIAKP